jgi:hypothetical protein
MFVQWGTFVKAADFATTLSIAGDALRAHDFQVFLTGQQGGCVVIGGSDAVIITISCLPEANGTFVAVAASANDEPTAELARNNVRTSIQQIVPID